MAQRSTGKGKAATRKDEGVLGSLSATRPSRLGRHARDGGETGSGAAAPKRSSAPKSRTSAKATTAKAATSAKRKPAAKAPAKAAAKTAPKSPATAPARSKPQPVRAGAPRLEQPAIKPADVPRAAPIPERDGPSGAELATTVVKAAGELAQIGLTIGGQILKRATSRLPKP